MKHSSLCNKLCLSLNKKKFTPLKSPVDLKQLGAALLIYEEITNQTTVLN